MSGVAVSIQNIKDILADCQIAIENDKADKINNVVLEQYKEGTKKPKSFKVDQRGRYIPDSNKNADNVDFKFNSYFISDKWYIIYNC
jgi:tRNA(Ser,Leu) C12 N-acetylase TAN1